MILHLVSRSPFADSALEECLACLGMDDELLLLQDAVVAAAHSHTWSRRLLQLTQRVHALSEDLKARGLSDSLEDGLIEVDYPGFVQLTLRADSVCSWG